MKPEVISKALVAMVNQRHLRSFLAGKIDKYIYKEMVNDASGDLRAVQEKRYQFLSAILHCVVTNIDKGYISTDITRTIIDVLVRSHFTCENQGSNVTVEKYKEKYGEEPPTFIVLSPTQKCNLMCIGCYASSTADTSATIPYEYVDKIVSEVHDCFGSRFITISGGEPLAYHSEDKTLFDIFEKYGDMFFLMYTNGTLINDRLAERLAQCANVTPAVSVEGFEEHTDQRRGKGTYRKILDALERLRKAGVPFGISVTATSKNTDVLLDDGFYDFYFEQQGACYMWQFQLMPIGRGKDEIDLMVAPEKRLELYRKWEKLLSEKRYCIADFWNSGVLSRGCIAYGRGGGYFYIDWNGNVTPCAFIPYYVDNIYDLYRNGKTLVDALFSDFMKNGRKWQRDYGLNNWKCPKNWLMPCSIRDHYEVFRNSVITGQVRPEDEKAREALQSPQYMQVLTDYDKRLQNLTEKIWQNEYLNV
jgi:MoaA/NifB/PqqE/SkfB family radical SAM enzyme